MRDVTVDIKTELVERKVTNYELVKIKKMMDRVWNLKINALIFQNFETNLGGNQCIKVHCIELHCICTL